MTRPVTSLPPFTSSPDISEPALAGDASSGYGRAQKRWGWMQWATWGLAASTGIARASRAQPASVPLPGLEPYTSPLEMALRRPEAAPARLPPTGGCPSSGDLHSLGQVATRLVDYDDISNAPGPIKFLLRGLVWRGCGTDGEVPGAFAAAGGLTLSYTFDHPLAKTLKLSQGETGDGLQPVPDEMRARVRDLLHHISRYADLNFVEVDDAFANVHYSVAKAKCEYSGFAQLADPFEAGILMLPDYARSRWVLAHETGHAVGALDDLGFNRFNASSDEARGWLNSGLGTVMSYNHVYRQAFDDDYLSFSGPADLAAYAYLYGSSHMLRGNTEHFFGPRGSFFGLHDDDGVNTLTAPPGASCFLSLSNNAGASVCDGTVVMLSPTSTFQRANASATTSAVVTGNEYDNILIGSLSHDRFVVGAGRNWVESNGGCDWVVVNDETEHVTVTGIRPSRLRLGHEGLVTHVQHEACGRDICLTINHRTEVRVVGSLHRPRRISVVPHASTLDFPRGCDVMDGLRQGAENTYLGRVMILGATALVGGCGFAYTRRQVEKRFLERLRAAGARNV